MNSHPPFTLVRVPFPFTDRQSQKRRPSLVLSIPEYQQRNNHLLLAMVTTAARSNWRFDWPIQDLANAGLKRPCVVRFKLFSLDQRLVLDPLGELSSKDQQGVVQQLQVLLGMPIPPSSGATA